MIPDIDRQQGYWEKSAGRSYARWPQGTVRARRPWKANRWARSAADSMAKTGKLCAAILEIEIDRKEEVCGDRWENSGQEWPQNNPSARPAEFPPQTAAACRLRLRVR